MDRREKYLTKKAEGIAAWHKAREIVYNRLKRKGLQPTLCIRQIYYDIEAGKNKHRIKVKAFKKIARKDGIIYWRLNILYRKKEFSHLIGGKVKNWYDYFVGVFLNTRNPRLFVFTVTELIASLDDVYDKKARHVRKQIRLFQSKREMHKALKKGMKLTAFELYVNSFWDEYENRLDKIV